MAIHGRHASEPSPTAEARIPLWMDSRDVCHSKQTKVKMTGRNGWFMTWLDVSVHCFVRREGNLYRADCDNKPTDFWVLYYQTPLSLAQVTFISHQWLGHAHPDPSGQQLAVSWLRKNNSTSVWQVDGFKLWIALSLQWMRKFAAMVVEVDCIDSPYQPREARSWPSHFGKLSSSCLVFHSISARRIETSNWGSQGRLAGPDWWFHKGVLEEFDPGCWYPKWLIHSEDIRSHLPALLAAAELLFFSWDLTWWWFPTPIWPSFHSFPSSEGICLFNFFPRHVRIGHFDKILHCKS